MPVETNPIVVAVRAIERQQLPSHVHIKAVILVRSDGEVEVIDTRVAAPTLFRDPAPAELPDDDPPPGLVGVPAAVWCASSRTEVRNGKTILLKAGRGLDSHGYKVLRDLKSGGYLIEVVGGFLRGCV